MSARPWLRVLNRTVLIENSLSSDVPRSGKSISVPMSTHFLVRYCNDYWNPSDEHIGGQSGFLFPGWCCIVCPIESRDTQSGPCNKQRLLPPAPIVLRVLFDARETSNLSSRHLCGSPESKFRGRQPDIWRWGPTGPRNGSPLNSARTKRIMRYVCLPLVDGEYENGPARFRGV